MTPSVPPLFAGLVDDAGLFPPERLPMAAAVERHRADARRGHPVLSHRFLCPASQVGALRAQLRHADALRLGVIVDTGVDGVAPAAAATSDDRLSLETVEIPLPADQVADAAEQLAPRLTAVEARVFAEIPRVPGWRAALDVLADHGVGAKVRCGGVRADLFPSVAELAAFVSAAAALGVPFKATAGLHHAVRHRDPRTGFEHHGFLNLLLAVCRAVDGAPPDDIAAVLATDDATALAEESRAVTTATAQRARQLLVAYGSCSTSEPIDDLVGLRLIQKDAS